MSLDIHGLPTTPLVENLPQDFSDLGSQPSIEERTNHVSNGVFSSLAERLKKALRSLKDLSITILKSGCRKPLTLDITEKTDQTAKSFFGRLVKALFGSVHVKETPFGIVRDPSEPDDYSFFENATTKPVPSRNTQHPEAHVITPVFPIQEDPTASSTSSAAEPKEFSSSQSAERASLIYKPPIEHEEDSEDDNDFMDCCETPGELADRYGVKIPGHESDSAVSTASPDVTDPETFSAQSVDVAPKLSPLEQAYTDLLENIKNAFYPDPNSEDCYTRLLISNTIAKKLFPHLDFIQKITKQEINDGVTRYTIESEDELKGSVKAVGKRAGWEKIIGAKFSIAKTISFTLNAKNSSFEDIEGLSGSKTIEKWGFSKNFAGKITSFAYDPATQKVRFHAESGSVHKDFLWSQEQLEDTFGSMIWQKSSDSN